MPDQPEAPVGAGTPLEPHEGAEQELRKHIDVVLDRLAQEFEPRVQHDVVVREVSAAAAQFEDARVKTYVPVLVTRQVRLRLRELVGAVA